jgi:hypothetical protein
MPKEIMYKQCRMERQLGAAKQTRVAWIPEKYAVENETVKIKEPDGSWSDGWKILSASGESISEKYAVHQSHAHTRQRESSDI